VYLVQLAVYDPLATKTIKPRGHSHSHGINGILNVQRGGTGKFAGAGGYQALAWPADLVAADTKDYLRSLAELDHPQNTISAKETEVGAGRGSVACLGMCDVPFNEWCATVRACMQVVRFWIMLDLGWRSLWSMRALDTKQGTYVVKDHTTFITSVGLAFAPGYFSSTQLDSLCIGYFHKGNGKSGPILFILPLPVSYIHPMSAASPVSYIHLPLSIQPYMCTGAHNPLPPSLENNEEFLQRLPPKVKEKRLQDPKGTC
jgi:hypothetical protein